MADRAVWRTRQDDPRTWIGWAARDGSRWGEQGLRKCLLAVLFIAGYCFFTARPFPCLLSLAALVPLSGAFPKPQGAPETADPAPRIVFSGLVEVAREGVLLGEDRVVASFVDGWLVVEGLRTSFALRSTDLVEGTDGSRWDIVLTDGTRLGFRSVPTRLSGWSEGGLALRRF